MTAAPRTPVSAARIVYAGIVASTLITTAGALALNLTLGTATMAAGLPDWLALAAGGTALAAGYRLWMRLRASSSGVGGDAWWTMHSGRALVVWGVLELAAMAGAATAFATGHLAGFLVLAVLALGGLGAASPGRISGK